MSTDTKKLGGSYRASSTRSRPCGATPGMIGFDFLPAPMPKEDCKLKGSDSLQLKRLFFETCGKIITRLRLDGFPQQVCFWHEADIKRDRPNVGFWPKADVGSPD